RKGFLIQEEEALTFFLPLSVSINEICSRKNKEMKIPITIRLSDNWKVNENALINCGAKGGNFINSKFAERHSLPLKKLPKEILIFNAHGSENKGGKIWRYLKTQIEVARQTCDVVLLETSLGQETVILG